MAHGPAGHLLLPVHGAEAGGGPEVDTTGLLTVGVAAHAAEVDRPVTGLLLVGAAAHATAGHHADVALARLSVGVVAKSRLAADFPYPASISGRKLLDQDGNVFLLYTLSSWSLYDLPDADITQALEDVVANHFNGITMWIGGGHRLNATFDPRYERKDGSGDDWWTGTPWQSDLGPAWAAVDWVVEETLRLGLVLTCSFDSAFDTRGAGPDWEAATDADMYDVGVAVANRYPVNDYPHILWHIMLDSSHGPATTRGQRINALFEGINDTEGTSARPIRWIEVANGSTTFEQGWFDPTGATTDFRCSINCIYEYGGNSVELFEAEWGETSAPTGDCEPRYVGDAYTTGNSDQQLRERNYTIFIEGGCLINFGHSDWHFFGKSQPLSDGETWDTVVTDVETVEAGYAWTLIDEFCATSGWAATSAFVTTGEGLGDTKAAQGTDGTTAIAYFPDNRTVEVDTTILTGTANVRLRWYDPTAGTYSVISAGEAQQTARSVTLPAAHGDGTRDYVLVVDLVASEDKVTTGVFYIGLHARAPASRNAALALARLPVAVAQRAIAAHGLTITATRLSSAVHLRMGPPGQFLNICIEFGPPVFRDRVASVVLRDRTASLFLQPHTAGVPLFHGDHAATLAFVARVADVAVRDHAAGPAVFRERSTTLEFAHGEPDDPVLVVCT